MTPEMKKDKVSQTKDLIKLATPEDMAEILREIYANPFEELARRKADAEKASHHKNIHFWQTVEDMLYSPKNGTDQNLSH